MRKILAAALCTVLITTLCACKNETESQSGSIAESSAIPTITTSDNDRVNPISENDFDVDDVEGGVMITAYKGASPDVKIPETIGGKKVVSLRNMSFDSDTVTSVYIPAGAVEVNSDGRLYIYSDQFAEINVDPANSEFYSKDGVLYSKKDDTLLMYPRGKSDESFEIPNGTAAIGEYAFGNARKLRSVLIPESVKELKNGAFNNCENLDEANIPESITVLNAYVFAGSGTLGSLEIPKKVTKISGFAFSGSKWADAHADENGLVIVNGMLINGDNAKGDVTVPESVTEIVEGAFYLYDEITSVTVPNEKTVVSEYAFDCCDNLKSVTHDGKTYDPNE